MDPRRRYRSSIRERFPRARGEARASCGEIRPVSGPSPRVRGMVRKCPLYAAFCLGLPRTRGDGPLGKRRRPTHSWAAPSTRGWSLGVRGATPPPPAASPGHGGMVRKCPLYAAFCLGLPRTRGDRPAQLRELNVHEGAPRDARGSTEADAPESEEHRVLRPARAEIRQSPASANTPRIPRKTTGRAPRTAARGWVRVGRHATGS